MVYACVTATRHDFRVKKARESPKHKLQYGKLATEITCAGIFVIIVDSHGSLVTSI